MLARLKAMFTPRPTPAGITRALRAELDAMPPGQCLKLVAKDGAEFVILAADDHEHICSLAGLRSVPAKESSQT